jgi:DNA repair protein RadA/Sms
LASLEGHRALLLEVQALVGVSITGNPRRVANGCDLNRLLQIIAVLEKRVGLLLARQDVYANIVGGFEFADPAGDLAIAIAVATSNLDRSVDPYMIAVGEVGLSGEVRPVASLVQRLKEAAALGFKKALVPKANLPLEGKFDQLEVVGVEYLVEALNTVMPGANINARSARARDNAGTPGKPGSGDTPESLAADDPDLAGLLK